MSYASKRQCLKKRLEDKKESLDTILSDAFAVCREASVRVLGMRHFDVQLMGWHGVARWQYRRDENR